MGGVQSGPHSLGDVNVGRDALWVQERLRHKSSRVPREGGFGRHDNTRGSSSTSVRDNHQDKLLKRTKSLAVISEDNRGSNVVGTNNREANYYRLGEPALSEAFGRQQLIPRAKLINRHSLKDRLSKSQQHLSGSFEVTNPRSYRPRLTSDTYSVSEPHVSLPNFNAAQNLRQSTNHNSDRLNILEWPESPIPRYRSVQNLENVSGIVEIADENWHDEGNKNIDCIYTQVKRKRKEHRSLDSVLFEEDKELEYFNVLDLLPLSNVRLQFEDRNGSINGSSRKREDRDFLEAFEGKLINRRRLASKDEVNYDAIDFDEASEKSGKNCSLKNFESKKNCQRETETDFEAKEIAEAFNDSKIKEINESKKWSSSVNVELIDSSRLKKREEGRDKSSADKEPSGLVDELFYQKGKKQVLILDSDEDKFRADVALVRPTEEFGGVEEAEDYKSIWISDSEETEEMSRRPQVLKVIDNEVTKRNRNSVVETVDIVEAVKNSKRINEAPVEPAEIREEEVRVEEVKSYFETKCDKGNDGETVKLDQRNAGGKLERIIKETTSIFGKACNAVKGSLGFEARSESSDLGLGSESGSDTRRRSMDDVEGTGESLENEIGELKPSLNDSEKNNRSSGLSRSFSCMDSVKNEDPGPEFDHIRYKIMKSDLFSKNMFGSMKKDQAFDGLMQYLQEYSFHDLLVDNNVVIIEPVRAETIGRNSGSTCELKPKNSTSCRIAGTVEKRSQQKTREGENEPVEKRSKSPKQSSLRRHFFYHPIRVNRELIDDELPDPDTVRNVRKMFESTLKLKTPEASSLAENCPTRKTVSMKDLRQIDESFEGSSEKTDESRSSSRARNLSRIFENRDKVLCSSEGVNKDGAENPRSDSKTRIIAQAFEARSGQTSPSENGSSANKHKGTIKYLQNWDAGSVSSGVSSDYPDTDQGSGAHCTSSEEEEDEGQDEDDFDSGPGHFVSQEVLRKIREYGTSVTYYGGRVVDTHNNPLISPPINGGNKRMKMIMKNEPRSERRTSSKDYVKFRLVKSNSCDSRLELAGRLVNESKSKADRSNNDEKLKAEASKSDLRKLPIMENLNSMDVTMATDRDDEDVVEPEVKKEPPIVIGLEPKKEEIKEPQIFKADFKLGRLEDAKCYANKFNNTALNQWRINDAIAERKCKFGEIDFEEFEVLEDSLNSNVKKN